MTPEKEKQLPKLFLEVRRLAMEQRTGSWGDDP